jgi:uncharacterized protein YprB with RNaseH-like and TPR domain
MMLDPDTRRRLEKLNQGPLHVTTPPGGRLAPAPRGAGPLPLAEAVPGREARSSAGGSYYVADLAAERLGPEAVELGPRLVEAVELARDRVVSLSHDDVEVERLDAAESMAFLDIETGGLSAAPVFLVGALSVERGRVFCRQFLARDYSEEGPMLEALFEHLAGYPVLVTFNGKSFDVPFLVDRAITHRLTWAGPQYHMDVLHLARRRWRSRLPNCKLQTLEYYVAGRQRAGDIPGALIPDAYHEFVRTGDARRMRTIAHHNALDLLTTLQLVVHILTNDLGE